MQYVSHLACRVCSPLLTLALLHRWPWLLYLHRRVNLLCSPRQETLDIIHSSCGLVSADASATTLGTRILAVKPVKTAGILL